MAQKPQIQTKAPRAPEGTEESMDCKESRPACGLKPGFSNEAYIRLQSEKIRSRIGEFGGKLYMEFGGKLFDDYHASRVLPGFLPNSKLKMLCALGNDAEIVITINAADIENSKYREDFEKAGMITTGINPESGLTEIVEIPTHKWFVGVQFHPEYKSTVIKPHPLFVSFIKACLS